PRQIIGQNRLLQLRSFHGAGFYTWRVAQRRTVANRHARTAVASGAECACLRSMNAGELCNREVVICNPDTSLVRAARLMREHHVGCLVVVEPGDGNEPVGMITDRDLVVEGVAVDAAALASMSVEEIMTCELVTVAESEDVATVLARMTAFGVRR